MAQTMPQSRVSLPMASCAAVTALSLLRAYEDVKFVGMLDQSYVPPNAGLQVCFAVWAAEV